MKTYKLSPSLLAADFSMLGREVQRVADAGAHYIHIDVMDGHFVPTITIGPPVIRSMRKVSDIVFDVHLMITDPLKHIESFAAAGADIINFHVEAADDAQIREGIRLIRSLNKRPALTLKPATPAEEVYDYLADIDMVLVMSVEPGKGGQALIPDTLRKTERLAAFIANNGLDTDIEMDGGVYLDNVADVLAAGVNVVVAGTSVFRADNPVAAVKAFYEAFYNEERRTQDKEMNQ